MQKILRTLKRLVKKETVIIAFILLLAFVARLYKINSPLIDWHSWRQADTAAVTRIYVDEGVNLLFPKYYDISVVQSGLFNPQGYRFVEFPFYNLVHLGLLSVLPFLSLEVSGRLLSIICVLVSTYLVYLFGRRFINQKAGLIAAFFFALLPYNVYFSRVILPEPMAVMLGLLGIWFFVKYVDSDRLQELLLSSVFFSLALLVKPFTGFYLIPVAFLFFQKNKWTKLLSDKKLVAYGFIFALIAFTPFILWRKWIGNFPEGIPFWRWAFNDENIRFRPSFWKWIFGERIGKLILGMWGLIPFSIGLLKPTKKNFFIYFFLFGTLLHPVIFAAANIKHDYYQTYLMPAIALVLGNGFVLLWNTKEFDKYLARAVLVFVLFMMFLVSADQVKEFYKYNYPQIVEAGQRADELLPKDAQVIAPLNGDTAFLYHTKRYGWPVKDEDISDMIEKGADYYASVDPKSQDSLSIASEFEVIAETDRYIIVDLSKARQ